MRSSSRSPISFDVAATVARATAPVQDRPTQALSVDSIQPSPRNPRHKLTHIDELAASISARGLLQPVIVRRLAKGYELIDGHRRFEAVRSLGLVRIDAVIRDEDRNEAYVSALVANLQREDLTPIEEAEGLGVLVRERKWSVHKVASAIKRDPMYVSRRLRVFEDPVLRQPVLDRLMPISTAEVLLRADPEWRPQLVEKALADSWDQRAATRAVIDSRSVTLQSSARGVEPQADRSRYLVDLLTEVLTVLEAGLNDLSPKALRTLQTTYRQLSQLQPAKNGRG